MEQNYNMQDKIYDLISALRVEMFELKVRVYRLAKKELEDGLTSNVRSLRTDVKTLLY